MTGEKEQDIVNKRANLARALLEDEHFNAYIVQFNEEYNDLWNQLRDTATTDPRIAEIQGRLNMLADIIRRPELWVRAATNLNRQLRISEKPFDNEDLERG